MLHLPPCTQAPILPAETYAEARAGGKQSDKAFYIGKRQVEFKVLWRTCQISQNENKQMKTDWFLSGNTEYPSQLPHLSFQHSTRHQFLLSTVKGMQTSRKFRALFSKIDMFSF